MRQVRSSNSSYSRQNNRFNSNSKIWWIVIIVIFFVLWFKFFTSWNKTDTKASEWEYLTVIPWEKSLVQIVDKNKKENPITWEQKLFTTDSYLDVNEGSATIKLKTSYIDLDEKTQISYKSSSIDWENIKLEKWRIWTQSNSTPLIVELKRMNVKIPEWSIALLEQTNTAFSVAYAIQWNIEISTVIWQYTLKPWQWIKLSDNNLTSEKTKLSDLVDEIDASIVNNVVFSRNNWEEILKKATQKPEENKNTEWQTSSWTNTENQQHVSKFISFTQPIDWTTVTSPSINIMWTLLSPEVTRVTINDIDASVSPVNQTFVLQDFKLTSEINNIVYKVYSTNNIQLDIGVMVIYWPKNQWTQTTIIPQNYPISSTDFKIKNKNPYTTTEDYVRVEWTVPKWTVEYITVNDYRLQKFKPNSEVWYYHANAAIWTIKEWTNLYYIKFFDKNNKLLYTQLFTIIKDSKSNNTENEKSSLFPS